MQAAKGTYAGILRSPRITEKASFANEKGTYVFIVAPRASKRDIKMAVREIYGVSPRKVAITKIPAKVIFNRRIRGIKAGGKKAYVYLKAGDKIEMV
ncbi:50S ribosomal protein L23 [Candidatus Kaiserbacteria bacterium RIFCSPHIGHO2_02_FULL_50_9]|uniref:Large ribosomal subunit protein uL23 n=1 Tax=Candidatus Kaiserbacteria bacterium RIFCSPLOWO2_01_FULL_51_21 TaxID=1798508 RepID=A0A1F6ECM4_9BACT|nr:MAG: 50S ribosomal protein L23 [Candidatus Kaiserbacteria bacterium RIFCSPHIGHO2_01_FULL_51_33]OGG63370.1 MAG: 50S ribosomal protein L23 [Candidatus Kaiserbacteria bacterium RIFCSPHIGHO2_02_FULL_50_9]OGG71428.1 MAG: 50S ribosomal protein L23 [Candidatus Kaiserbacteria bacterium RIFCSPLOWO2_01_FULL_51_21]